MITLKHLKESVGSCEKCGSTHTNLEFVHFKSKEKKSGVGGPPPQNKTTYRVCNDCGHKQNITKPLRKGVDSHGNEFWW